MTTTLNRRHATRAVAPPIAPDHPDLAAIPGGRTTVDPGGQTGGKFRAGGKFKAEHIRMALMDERIDAAIITRAHSRPDSTVILYDTMEPAKPFGRGAGRRLGAGAVAGLRMRIGPRSASWIFFRDYQDARKATKDNPRGRVVISKPLGRYDLGTADGKARKRAEWHVGTDAARIEAQKLTGQIAGGKVPAGKRNAATFGDVFALYLDYLAEGTADEPGLTEAERANRKPARWRRNVKSLGNKWLLPTWGAYTLADLSKERTKVAEWYRDIARELPPTAAKVRAIIGQIYKWRQTEGDDLPGANPAGARVKRVDDYKPNRPSLPLADFPIWLAAWRKLPPMNRAYHLVNLLVGARPGELIRRTWASVDDEHQTLTVENSKNGDDIVVPMSEPIKRALALALEAAGGTVKPTDLIFPGPNNEHWAHRDALPVRGHALRRTFKTCATTLLIPNELSGRLLGHRPPGTSEGYNDPLEVQRAALLRDLQARVSAEMLRLFGCDPTTEKVAPLPPSPREVARVAGLAEYASDQRCPAGHVAPLRSVATNRCCECVRLKNFRQKSNRVDWRRKKKAATR